MEQQNNTTESRKGKHLTREERQQIETLRRAGLTARAIAELLGGRSARTIRRELARGTVDQMNSDLTMRREYSYDVGQMKHDEYAKNKGRSLKIGSDHEFARYIEEKIGKEKMSPYAALQQAKNDGKEFVSSVCVKTLYNYIESGLFLHISKGDLPQKGRQRKRKYDKIRRSHKNLLGTSISDRPAEIENRDDFGHWEFDTVVGKKSTKSVLLVMSERETRFELIFKLKSKTEAEVVGTLDMLEHKLGKERFRKVFKTITCDNGCENLDFKGMEKGGRTKVFYAHPYSAWERGTNENINRMIRRFIPKGEDIGKYTKAEIKRIQDWINNYPRRILGGLSSMQLLKSMRG